MQGDTAKARTAYQDFLTLWKDADPDIPILVDAKKEFAGKCCNFEGCRRFGPLTISAAWYLGWQFEELLDELNLTPNIVSAHPAHLALPDHVHGFVALNGSPTPPGTPESLLGVHSAFDRSVILLQNVVQILHRSMPATAAQGPFLLYICDG